MSLKSVLYSLCGLMLLSGCVMGQKYSFHDVDADLAASGSKQVSVTAQDLRPSVISRDKEPDVVGVLRGGFGNPFTVTTESGKPLADDLTQVISAALTKRGFVSVPVAVMPNEPSAVIIEKLVAAKGEKLLWVTINEWRSDSYVNCAVHYDLHLKVFDKTGQLIAENRVHGSDNLGGSMNTARYAKVVVPASFKKKIEELFNKPSIVKALQE